VSKVEHPREAFWHRVVKITSSLEKTLMTPATKAKKHHDFNSSNILAAIGNGVRVVALPGKQKVFAQGDTTGDLFYIHKGKVRLAVVSKFGKEVTLSMLSEGEFFGDGGLAGQPLRKDSATAMTDCTLLQIDSKAMISALQRDCTLADLYVAYLLARNIRYHEALVDQLFDPCEKRIARVLLSLARFGRDGTPKTTIPKICQQTLAEMAGTTRVRVGFFMKRFRESGFLAYSRGGLKIHSSLLAVVLRD
jgi:CRP/FNR family transcriptional regulator, cyclic AMP receptor protein